MLVLQGFTGVVESDQGATNAKQLTPHNDFDSL